MKSNDKTDYDVIRKIAESDAGKKLLQLVQNQGGSQIKNAIKQAENGNFDEAKILLNQILETPEASRLLREMEAQYE